ncbi:hypothetical protein FB567DRAFT_48068 [Paraphoma chrysanthemicola]|uniref:Lipocalin-like domain-containing protein n=1 Tax=Paraphoma chrysanthemicola TaxID=798071 RepID=A0A8K0W6A6_9PLEO|nr:hypothetical protein FB567DRAFT_48068 [Paraphoma chrysanthemicola]
MALPHPPQFREPILPGTSNPTTTNPTQTSIQDRILGTWFLIRSSNPFWKPKLNIHIEYTPVSAHISDRAFYQTTPSSAIKSIDGKDTPATDGSDTFTWQGTGFMRIASAKWEVLSFTTREGGDWMLVYVHKSMFTPAAVNLMCRTKGGVSETDREFVRVWLEGVRDEGVRGAGAGMVDILQE